MLLLLTGDSAGEVAERLRNYFSYRGVACVICDFWEPANLMHDAAMLSLQQFSQYVELPVKDIFGESRNASFLQHARDWDELQLSYVVILHGEMTTENLEKFPKSYKILLTQGKIPDCPEPDHSDEGAAYYVFDGAVDMNRSTPEDAANFIGANLYQKNKDVYIREMKIFQKQNTPAQDRSDS
jgi:hypothetical protein